MPGSGLMQRPAAVCEVGEKLIDFRGAHILGMALVVKDDESNDPARVGLFSPIADAPAPSHVTDSIQQPWSGRLRHNDDVGRRFTVRYTYIENVPKKTRKQGCSYPTRVVIVLVRENYMSPEATGCYGASGPAVSV